jgi:hypothetical protein
VEPDWKALYSERLGQSVTELDKSTLGQEYLDPASGALTHVAWTKLKNGEMVLLGFLPMAWTPKRLSSALLSCCSRSGRMLVARLWAKRQSGAGR